MLVKERFSTDPGVLGGSCSTAERYQAIGLQISCQTVLHKELSEKAQSSQLVPFSCRQLLLMF